MQPPSRMRKAELLPSVVIEIKTPLRPADDPREYLLTLGKIQNLRVATRQMDRLLIAKGQTFSFWFTLGRLTRQKGYVPGREVRQGCIIPNVGGGICQLSNALYQAALATGCTIIERHRHTITVPGSDADRDRDATVAWNDIDLRFRAPMDLQIECFLTSDDLVLRFRSREVIPEPKPTAKRKPLPIVGANSCVTCGQESCSMHAPELKFRGSKGPTWLMDRYWPEWEQARRELGGRLIVPRQGQWTDCETAPLASAIRSARARFYRGRPPAVVRRAQLDSDRFVARSLAKRLKYIDDDLVVALSLAPHLWESGALDGRRFMIALDRAPLSVLQAALDSAAKQEPESPTLRDFRADQCLMEMEEKAIGAAQAILTPHAGLAELYPQAKRLDWVDKPRGVVNRVPQPLIVFPGPATARSGSKIVRDVARKLDLSVMLLGSMLEDRSLWDGITLVPAGEWQEKALAVVQPSVLTNRPDALLVALAAEVPVAAGHLCGLPKGTFHEVAFGDAAALEQFLSELLSQVGWPIPHNRATKV